MAGRHAVSRGRRRLPFWASLALNALAALLVLSLVQAYVVKVYRVPSTSMEPALRADAGGGDRILVNRAAYLGSEPKPGDIVVFSRPEAWNDGADPRPSGLGAIGRAIGDVTGIGPSNEHYLVKRVAARGGQTVACCDAEGRLELDGRALDEPYVSQDLPFIAGRLDCTTTPRSERCFAAFAVPTGELVVLGDHRSASADSTLGCRVAQPGGAPCLRTVPNGLVIGRVAFRLWPLDRAGVVG
ncbi:signal peptidase I [Sinomonas sp. P47F7]|uniref:signal peptidase I n=1 Tax=Sinomonas sp. P47F7 TaxID=3410987 RepID=UPI003BF497D2